MVVVAVVVLVVLMVLVIKLVAFYSKNPSLNPAEVYRFYPSLTKINEKDAEMVAPYLSKQKAVLAK